MRSAKEVAQLVAFLASFSLLCLSHGANDARSITGFSNYTFPYHFKFGVASAAFQIEGGWNEGGKGESMWDTYIHKHPDYTPDRSNGDIAADSYHNYMEDIAMVKSLRVKYYRLSISWPRLLPQGTDNIISIDGMKYYRTIFEELIKVNITPIVTLFHWDMPTPFMDLGGWANPKIGDYFVDYARVAFDLYGDIIKTWTTMNEPHQHCYNGYGGTFFVPVLDSHGIGDYLCNHYILLAHARVYHLYDKEYRPKQKGIIGITLDAFMAVPKDPTKIEDHEAAERYLQMHLGLYAHPIFSKTGDYPELVRNLVDNKSFEQGYSRSRLPYFTKEEVRLLRGSSDFFGLNHYTTYIFSPSEMEPDWKIPSIDHDTGVKMEQNPLWPVPACEWLSVYPPGFRKVLNWITRNYGTKVPIIVTENGVCDKGFLQDFERISYFNEYLDQLLLAIYEDGCNIQGYFAWTLMDDFEWSDGYLTKFGLFHVDFNSTERTRTPKLSALNYAEIVRTGKIDPDRFKRPSNTFNANRL